MSAPIDTATPHLGSLDYNHLCGLDDDGEGEYTTEGITKLCEGLKESAVTSLKCAAPSNVRQCPLTRMVSHRPRPSPRSLGANDLTNDGKDMSGLLKLVKILPETKIESLRCAAAPCVRFCVSAR